MMYDTQGVVRCLVLFSSIEDCEACETFRQTGEMQEQDVVAWIRFTNRHFYMIFTENF